MRNRILKKRDDRVFDAWRRIGMERAQIEPLLRIFQEGMDYCNHYFLPDDVLVDFVNDDSYDFSVLEILEEIARQYPNSCTSSLIQVAPKATIGQFVIEVLNPSHS